MEFRPLLLSFAVGFPLVLALTAAAWFLFGSWMTAVVVAVLVTGAIAAYERAYAATAARTRARLA